MNHSGRDWCTSWLGWRDSAQASCASPFAALTYDEPDLSKAQGVRIPPERYKKDSHWVSRFYMAGMEGFEPPILGPEPSALPLGHIPIICFVVDGSHPLVGIALPSPSARRFLGSLAFASPNPEVVGSEPGASWLGHIPSITD